MGNAKWWACDECKSLNDMPAKKCYKCRAKKPAEPTLIDDQYGQVGKSRQRVGVSVDRSLASRLVSSDPAATADARPPDSVRPDAMGDGPAQEDTVTVAPLREPPKRSIAVLGGQAWTTTDADAKTRLDDPATQPKDPAQPSVGQPASSQPPAPRQVPPPGYAPYPPYPTYPMYPPPGPPARPPQVPPPGYTPRPGQLPPQGYAPWPPYPGPVRSQTAPRPRPPRKLPSEPPGPPAPKATPAPEPADEMPTATTSETDESAA